MNITLKIPDALLSDIRSDLLRRHVFAYERVGFLACKPAALDPAGWILLGAKYYPVADEDYLRDDSVGAMIGSDAIRKALQLAYNQPFSMVHIHMHPHSGPSRFSEIDECETAKMIPDFWHVRPNLPHAAIVLSFDSLCGFVWVPESKQRVSINDFTIVGTPMRFVRQNS